MPNLKNIQIIVDSSSWSGKPVPQEISSLQRIRRTDIDRALLHTALWTRPPKYTGFDLSDCWAWLRYQRSFATTSNLRLCSEWDDIDSHQKTVSSDELGVGFTTQLFAEELGFLAYVDTKYMVQTLKSPYFRLGKNIKRGPTKSPDYVVIDSNLEFSILECKGTQSSPKKLNDAIKSGISQKNNVTNRGGAKVRHSLVAGLFIPQWKNPDDAVIQISDPEWEELSAFLSESRQYDLFVAVAQITLAKHFALMGFYSMANALMSLDITNSNTSQLPNISSNDRDFIPKGNRDDLNFVIELPLPPHENYEADIRAKARRLNFQMSYPANQFDRLMSSHHVLEDLYEITISLKEQQWKHIDTETTVELFSPFGFSMKLEYLY